MQVICPRSVQDIPRPAGRRRVTATAAALAGLLAASLAPAAGAEPRAGKSGPGQAGVAADLALRHGAIYTLDESRSWAQALAIRGNRIVYVGTDAGLRQVLGSHTRVVDLHGRMVLPGLQDAHIHPISGGIQAQACDLSGQSTAEQYVDSVRRFAASHPDEAWITGGGWLLSAFGPGGQARKELLDAVVPDRPVYLASTDGHTVWVNTLALKLAHITAETPDPPDGLIDRDAASHEPLGTLQEGASAAVDAILPPVSPAARIAGLEYAVKMLNGFGITAIQDAAVYENDLKAYRALERRQGLSLRVVAALWWERGEGLGQIPRLERLRRTYRSALVDTGTVKIMLDGSLENYTAALLDPYLTPEGGRGTTMIDAEALKTIVTRLDAAGFQVHFHTIGDRTVRVALDAIAAAQAADGQLDRRHTLAHLEMVDDADVARFREMGVVANFQPLWAYADPYVTQLTIPFLGPERTRLLYRIGALQRSGAVLAFGSDWSVSSANPFEQIQVAVTRMNPAGGDQSAFLPEERISLADAIAAFTTGSAFVNRLERRTGSLEVGKLADLAILDQNLFAVPADRIGRTQVLATLFDGRLVHGSLEGL